MPYTFTFPTLRFLGARAVQRLVEVPIFSVNRRPLRGDPLGDFSSQMFGERLNGSLAGARLQRFALNDPDVYRGRLLASLRPVVESAYQSHSSTFGSDSQGWDQQALGTVYSGEQAADEDGHGVVVVTFEPHPDPRSFLRDANLFRYYLQSFPGLSASLTVDQYLRILRGWRDIDGVPISVIDELWPEIVSHNQQQFRTGAELTGPYLLGGNSYVMPLSVSSVTGDGAYLASALMGTSLTHSQDGVVPWTFYSHPDLGNALCCVSLHYGNHPIVGGNAINSAIAARLFKLIYRRGTLRGLMQDDLVHEFGEARAALGLLDPGVRSFFEGRLRSIDWRLNWDSAVLSAMDSSGGAALNALRLVLGGDTVSSVTRPTIELIEDGDEERYASTLLDGVERTRADGYDGPPTVVPETSDALVVVPGTHASGAESVSTPSQDRPLLPKLREAGDALEAASRDLPWDAVREQIRDAITSKVEGALRSVDDVTSKSVEELVTALDDAALRTSLRDVVSDAVVTALATTEAYTQATHRLGANAASTLVRTVVADPLFARMTEAVDDGSYLGARIEEAVARGLDHRLREAAADIQARLARASDAVEKTSAEMQAQQAALDEVKKSLDRKPKDPDLQEEEARLEAALESARERAREAEEEQADAERAKRDNESRSEDAARQEREAGDAAERRGGSVFEPVEAP